MRGFRGHLARRLLANAGFAALVLAGCSQTGGSSLPPVEPVGLTTSLPILWRESTDIASLLDTDAPRHWALDVLEEYGPVRGLDDLAGDAGNLPLPRTSLLVIAQPRPLSPDENVALDGWVRAGGRVLLFADPMLSAESGFALGDRRRPQDVVLLSPILSRWWLELQFDEQQPAGERVERAFGQTIPVRLAGRFALSGDATTCTVDDSGLAARCPIGEGHVLAVADAALLEEATPSDLQLRQAALRGLLTSLGFGEGAGGRGEMR